MEAQHEPLRFDPNSMFPLDAKTDLESPSSSELVQNSVERTGGMYTRTEGPSLRRSKDVGQLCCIVALISSKRGLPQKAALKEKRSTAGGDKSSGETTQPKTLLTDPLTW